TKNNPAKITKIEINLAIKFFMDFCKLLFSNSFQVILVTYLESRITMVKTKSAKIILGRFTIKLSTQEVSLFIISSQASSMLKSIGLLYVVVAIVRCLLNKHTHVYKY